VTLRDFVAIAGVLLALVVLLDVVVAYVRLRRSAGEGDP